MKFNEIEVAVSSVRVPSCLSRRVCLFLSKPKAHFPLFRLFPLSVRPPPPPPQSSSSPTPPPPPPKLAILRRLQSE